MFLGLWRVIRSDESDWTIEKDVETPSKLPQSLLQNYYPQGFSRYDSRERTVCWSLEEELEGMTVSYKWLYFIPLATGYQFLSSRFLPTEMLLMILGASASNWKILRSAVRRDFKEVITVMATLALVYKLRLRKTVGNDYCDMWM